MQVQPYLFFDGRCEEALDFYKKALKAEVSDFMRFKDNPTPPTDGQMCTSEGGGPINPDKVMHATMRVGETSILASDGMRDGKPVFQGFSLAAAAKNEAEANRMFAALSDGGQVQVPLQSTFFSPRFGVVADRFGVSWMIMVQPANPN